jgi:tRNA(Ile2)-agmatinylcytidine synthase
MECEKTNLARYLFGKEFVGELRLSSCDFLEDAVKDVIEIEDSKGSGSKLGIASKGYKNGRGLIGALAACGAMLNPEGGFHLRASGIQEEERWELSAAWIKKSFFEADRETYPKTWDTVDLTNRLVVLGLIRQPGLIRDQRRKP